MDNLDDIVTRRRRLTPETIRENIEEDLPEDEELQESSVPEGRTILGRNRDAEARVSRMNSSPTAESSEPTSEDEVLEQEIDEQTEHMEQGSEQHRTRPDTTETLDKVGLFGRLILVAAVALVIFTMGKYAFDSLLNYDVKKTTTDFEENLNTLIGKDVEETEDVLEPALEFAETGLLTYDVTVDYTYDKKSKTVHFEVNNMGFNILSTDYKDYKFKKKGKLVVTITEQVDTDLENLNLVDFTIKEVL